jgi:hypothetical protein
MGHGQANSQRKKKRKKVLVPKPVTLASNEFQKKEKKNETAITSKYYTRDRDTHHRITLKASRWSRDPTLDRGEHKRIFFFEAFWNNCHTFWLSPGLVFAPGSGGQGQSMVCVLSPFVGGAGSIRHPWSKGREREREEKNP